MKPKPKKPPDLSRPHLFSSSLPSSLSLTLRLSSQSLNLKIGSLCDTPLKTSLPSLLLCSVCRFSYAPYPVFTAFMVIFVRYCGSLDEGKLRLQVTMFHNRVVQRWTDSCDETPLVQIYIGPTAGNLALRFSGHVFWTRRCVCYFVLFAYVIITFLEILTIAYVNELFGITWPMRPWLYNNNNTSECDPAYAGSGISECRQPYPCEYHYSQRGRFQRPTIFFEKIIL